ncbi:MAG: serpin family protein [Anaerolineae bacterium]
MLKRTILLVSLTLLVCTQVTSAQDTPDFTPLVEGNNAFAFDLYQQIAADSEDNILYSPYSISLALAMTYAGARGETEQQMQDTLHFALPQSELHPMFGDLNNTLNSRAEEFAAYEVEALHLNIANALWGEQTLPFQSGFTQTLEQNYAAALRLVDFINAAEDARVTVNDWVADETEDRIQDLVPQGVITPDTRLVLANAIYFQAGWMNTFDEAFTRDDTFNLLDGTQVMVPMMNLQENFLYTAGDGYQAIQLPYWGDMSMLVFLPDDGQFETFEQALSTQTLSDTLGNLTPQDVNLAMPRFEYEFSVGLNDILSALGMPIAFTDDADFSGMADAPLSISDVLHKAYIKVDESGTEAAAATAVVVGVTSVQVPQEVIALRIDRPFLYVIYDQRTNTLLFMGRVLNPQGE